MRPRNADWRVLEIGVTSLAGRTDMGGVLLTARDVTERRRLEEQLRQAQKMEAVGQLAGGVAHDFNNLLTAIRGYSELLLDDAAGRQRPRPLEIPRAGERGAALTRQLLAFSRRQVLEPKVLDLNDVVARPREHAPAAARRGHPFEHARWTPSSARQRRRGQLEQVLMNLVVNARDAMPRGGTLTIETADVDLDGGYAATAAGAPGAYVLLASATRASA